MSGNSRAYALGATAMTIGLSAVTKISAEAGEIDGFFNIQAGGGTLVITNGPSLGVGVGCHALANQVYELKGPAAFYLSAVGAAMTVAVVKRFSQGHSFV